MRLCQKLFHSYHIIITIQCFPSLSSLYQLLFIGELIPLFLSLCVCVCVFLPMLWVSIAGKVQITGWRGQARRADMPEADKHQLPCLAKTRSTWHTGSIPPVDQPESSLWGLALRCPTHLIPWLTASTFHPSLSFVVNTTHLATEAHTNISFVILSTLLPRFFCFHKFALHTKGKRNHTNTSVCKHKQLSPFSSSPSQSEHRSPTGSDENWLFFIKTGIYSFFF